MTYNMRILLTLCLLLVTQYVGASKSLPLKADVDLLDIRTELQYEKGISSVVSHVKASDLNDNDAQIYVFKKFGYGDMGYGLMKFQAQDPMNVTYIKPFSTGDASESISAATYVNGEYWVYVYQSWWGGSLTIPVGIGVLDPETGEYEIKYSTSSIHYYNEHFIEMTYDPSTNKVYGVQYVTDLSSDGTRMMDLWVIDPAEGTYEPKRLGKVDAYMFGMAARDGVVYGITQDYTDNDLSMPEKVRLIKFDPTQSVDGIFATTHIADIDGGNRVIRFDQTMEFDHATGRLWWSAQETANNGGYVCEIDILDGSLRHENRIPDASQYVAMAIPYQTVATEAPSYVSEFSAKADQQNTRNIMLKWTNPTQNYGCKSLTALTGVKIYRDGVEVADVATSSIGETMTWTDENVEAGLHLYRIVAYNNAGDGLWREREAYAGMDVPGQVQNLNYVTKGDKLTMTWDAPLSGKHDGWFDTQSLSYDVYRGTYKVATGLTTGSFEDKVNYYDHFIYKVVPVTTDGEGESVELTISYGPAYELPYINDLSDDELIDELTVVDGNNDSHSWDFSADEVAFIYTSHYENVADDYLFLPAFNVEAGKTYRYTFDYIISDYTNATEDFSVVLASSASAEGVKSVLQKYENMSGADGAVWRSSTVDFSFEEDDVVTLAIHIYSRQGMGKVGLRNFMVREVGEVEAAAVSVNAAADMYQSEETDVKVTMKNVGLVSIESPVIRLVSENGEELASTTVKRPLDAGQSREVTISLTPSELGSYRIYAAIDVDGDEYEDDNCTPYTRISVHPKDGERFLTIGAADGHKVGNIVDFTHKQSRSQTLYYSDEMNQSENIYITGMMLAYTPSIDADYLDAVPVSVHMANTKTSRILDSTYGGSFIDINTMTEVYDLDMQLNGEDEQYNEMWIRFDQPFEYDCTKNLVVDIYKKLEEQYYNVGWYVDYSSGISYRGAYWSNGYDYEMDPQHTSMNYVPYTKFSYVTNLGVQSVDVSTLTYKVQGDYVVYSAICDEVDIYNMAGVRVKSLTDVSRVDISSLGAGVYLIATKTSQNSIVHKVLVK